MSELVSDTPARERLATDLLGWGQPRPVAEPRIARALWSAVEEGLRRLEPDLSRVAAAQRGGHLLVTKTKLDRMVCDGLQLDPEPFVHSWASVRGILGHAVIERDWELDRRDDVPRIVRDVWHEQASRRPGDPSSLSAWMNAQDEATAEQLRDELTELLDSFREVWPPLPPERVTVRTEQAVAVPLLDGKVRLFGRPDLLLESRRRDDRARTLVVDLKTGRPRSEHDRHELRFYALLVTLAQQRPPFRWATYYVTEGRHEREDLREDVLDATVRRILDAAAQLVRLGVRELEAQDRDAQDPEAQDPDAQGDASGDARAGDPDDLRLRGGGWCVNCRRQAECPVAEQARIDRAVSQPDAML